MEVTFILNSATYHFAEDVYYNLESSITENQMIISGYTILLLFNFFQFEKGFNKITTNSLSH